MQGTMHGGHAPLKKSSGISLTFSPPGPPPCIGYPSKSAEGGPISRAVSACSAPVSQRAERAKGRGRQVRTVHAVVVDRVVAHGAEASAGHGGLEHDSLDLLHNACCGTAWRDLLQLRATHSSASTGHQAVPFACRPPLPLDADFAPLTLIGRWWIAPVPG